MRIIIQRETAKTALFYNTRHEFQIHYRSVTVLNFRSNFIKVR